MPTNPLVKKLKLDSSKRAAVINAPENYLKRLMPLPKELELSDNLSGRCDWIQIFVKTQAELKALMPKVLKAMASDSRLWISFPKGSSRIQTDLSRDKGWNALKGIDLKWVNLISVNEVWSAFNLRTYKPGEERQAMPWSE